MRGVNMMPRDDELQLIKALMEMVNRFFYFEQDGTLSHHGMTCEEQAIDVLVKLGYAEQVVPDQIICRLLWEKLHDG